jgi:SAM-dependent methyltransferase
LIAPSDLHSVGDGDPIAIGEEFLGYFVELAGLRPHERVLDVGCGTGRMAISLTRYLTTGSYDGIDIVPKSITWCRMAFSRRYSNFRFHFADIYNKAYNAKGQVRASEYRMPFETSSFDFVFLTSVFTHMLPGDLDNYLSEVARVLKPGGRCLITYFLLNAESIRLIEAKASTIAFPFELDGCRIKRKDVPEAAVAYQEARIRGLYKSRGLTVVEPIHFGSWSGIGNGLSYQDLVLADKPRR